MTNLRISTDRETEKLDAKDWIKAAMDVLAERGVDKVGVEPLAKRLGVTKGSFYWHFKDRDSLLEAILDDWRRRTTFQVIDRIEQRGDNAEERFRHLLRVPFHGRRSAEVAEIELSIRLWGRSDPRAQRALAEVDQLRLRYIRQLLLQCGVPETEVTTRAVLAYSYVRVGSTLPFDHSDEGLRACENALLGRTLSDI